MSDLKSISDWANQLDLTEEVKEQLIIKLEELSQKKTGGFFDLPGKKRCRHPEHNPPGLINIPQGQGYKHVCPRCQKMTIIIPQQHSL